MFTKDQISAIVKSQLVSLLWSAGEETDESGEFTGQFWDEYYTAEDATSALRFQLELELEDLSVYDVDLSADFAQALTAYVDCFGAAWASQFGHDLALTRNRHGAGFWDRGLGDTGDVLTDWAQGLGTLNVFHGHDSSFPAWAGKFHAE